MSQSQPGSEREICCEWCKSPNDPTSSKCWLCWSQAWRPLTDLSPIQKRARLYRTIARSMIVIAAIAAFLALAFLVPLAACLLGVFALPAWLVTEHKDLRRHERGEEGYSTGRKFAAFIGITLLFHIIYVLILIEIMTASCLFLI